MKKRWMKWLVLGLMGSLTLTACSNGGGSKEANAQLKELTNIYKIKLFELNENKDGKNLLKEYIINNINDLLHEPGTEILNYEIITDFTNSVHFRVNYKITPEIQTANELWYNKRFLDLRLIQSKQNENPCDISGGAIPN